MSQQQVSIDGAVIVRSIIMVAADNIGPVDTTSVAT